MHRISFNFIYIDQINFSSQLIEINADLNQIQSIINLRNKMSTSAECIEQLRNISILLEHNMQTNQEKIKMQQRIYTQLYRIFTKNATKLATLANSINEEVLSSANQQELMNQYYQMLSNSLLRLADCSRRVSLRCKSEVLDPLKTFNQNYENIYEEIKKKIDSKIESVISQDHEYTKSKDHYNQAYEKLEKHKQIQKKVMQKIESGHKNELDKLNNTTKKLTEVISNSQKFYLSLMQKVNYDWETLRRQFSTHLQQITYNQNTKVTFFRKTIMNSIKTLEQFNTAYDPEILKKIEQTGRIDNTKNEEISLRKLKFLLQKVTKNDFKQEFVSYEEINKNKKKKGNQQQVHLTQYFSKLKQKQKKIVGNILAPWFASSSKRFNQPISPIKQTTQNSQKRLTKVKSMIIIQSNSHHSKSNEKLTEKQIFEIDHCKQKIMSETLYSYYFIELLYQNIAEMGSFYCKVNQQNFLYILNAFTVITNNSQLNNEISIQFLYKMMVVSQRIMLKKTYSTRQNANQPIELLCQKFGKATLKFRDPKLLSRILAFIEKRKSIKKKNSNQNKGNFNFAKGFLAAFTRKNPILNEDELFNCLQQLIKIIANFSIPNEIILPFIKQAIGNSHQSSYQYLKAIILNKKDVQERQSLFYKKQIKQKKQYLMKKAIQNKRMGEYAIKIVAQHGFFCKKQLEYRCICKNLKDIHLQILGKLSMHTQQKWIRLIPTNKSLQFQKMKQEVCLKGVSSSVQEIITLDVNRSLHLHGALNPAVLQSLLRIYAYFHKDISYCQGMNYLAGYLYIKTMNQQSSYRIFDYLMNARFKEIFINQFEVLKVKMYQFQRLLAIFHPEISDHFKRQMISPECYIVSWIITLFASSYQYTLQSYLIDFLWQRFIIWGWPEFFRFVLWLFSLFKQDLVELTYDRALHFLGELGRSEMFLFDKVKYKAKFGSIEDPLVGIERYSVSEELLSKFTQEYKLDK